MNIDLYRVQSVDLYRDRLINTGNKEYYLSRVSVVIQTHDGGRETVELNIRSDEKVKFIDHEEKIFYPFVGNEPDEDDEQEDCDGDVNL